MNPNTHKPNDPNHKQAIENFKKLPEFCYAEHPSTGMPIRILRGEEGYYPPLHDGICVDEINGLLGVTYEQQEAMVVGSMFGWHVPAANPETWENDVKFQARLKQEGKNNAAEMRAAIAKTQLSKFYASLCLDDGGGYVTIYAKDREEARSKMFASKHGERWAFLYDESEKPEALDRYNQREIEVIN